MLINKVSFEIRYILEFFQIIVISYSISCLCNYEFKTGTKLFFGALILKPKEHC
jgi:hypothetical protein